MALRRVVPLLVMVLLPACSRPAPSTLPGRDAGDLAGGELAVRVPAGLRLVRALDTLSVSIDPAALATTTVSVDPGRFIGIASESFVFPLGGARPALGRRGLTSGHDFNGSVDVYNTKTDGLPVPGTRYVAEMTLVLFETDVAPGHEWMPESEAYKALWTRTIRQGEE